jgi:hypothetical protein
MEVAGTYKFKLVVTGNNDATKTEYVTVSAGLYYEVGFVSLGSAGDETINFSPKNTLPVGVTYILEDNKGINSLNSTGFNGVVNASGYSDGNVIFTQTFYLNGVEITGSTRTVNVGVDTFPDTYFMAIVSDTGSVTLKWPADMTLPITHAITVPAITFSPGTSLIFSQTITGWNSDFPASGLTYTLSSVNPVKDLSAYSNGNVPYSVYEAGDYPTITQTIFYNGQVVGSRKIVVERAPLGFANLYAYIPTEFDGVWYDTDFENIDAIPATTLLLRKNAGVVTKTVTTTLDIDAINFSQGTTLNFTPTYSNVSNPSHFTTNVINNCLTYTITVVNHDESYTHTWNSTDVGFDGQIPFRNDYFDSTYTNSNTFTQVFYHNGSQVGSPRVLKVVTHDGRFEYFGDEYSTFGDIPAINGVSISRTVTE